MLPHQTQIKICPYISLGINSHSQIAPVKLGKENSPVSSWPHAKCLPLGSARKATSLHPKDLGLASSNLPCFCKTTAKLCTETSVLGCCGPSWDFLPSKARRCSPSASRLEMECWGGETWDEPQLRPHGSWKGKNKPTKATIFGL